MKIEIHTIREIRAEDFWDWAAELLFLTINEGKIDLKRTKPDTKIEFLTEGHLNRLWETGEMSVSDDLGYTKATTTYKIVERKP
jgi:hypothetical protein